MENTASWVRRLVALAVDWAACSLVTLVVLGPGGYSDSPYSGWVTLAVFWLEASVLPALVGSSFGQLATRVAVVTIHGGPVTLLVALVRTALICLVVPPLVFKPDGRGLHDLVVGSVSVPVGRPGASG